jgi:sirohydrochlorin cobaltochelatase
VVDLSSTGFDLQRYFSDHLLVAGFTAINMNPSNTLTSLGIILFAHGSRDPLWKRPIEDVATRIRERNPQTPVACAYLELTQPDLAHAAASMIEEGIAHIRITPLFLGVGRHAREDLPVLVSDLITRHPTVHFELQAAVGENPQLIDLMAQIALNDL